MDGWQGMARIHNGREVAWAALIWSAIFIFPCLGAHRLALDCGHVEASACNCVNHDPQLSPPAPAAGFFKCYLKWFLSSSEPEVKYCHAPAVRLSDLSAGTNSRFVKLVDACSLWGRQNLNSFLGFNEMEILGHLRDREPVKGFRTHIKVALTMTHKLVAGSVSGRNVQLFRASPGSKWAFYPVRDWMRLAEGFCS